MSAASALLVFFGLAQVAFGACPVRPGFEAVGSSSDGDRLTALRSAHARTSAAERSWSNRWGYTWGGLATTQFVLAQVIREKEKPVDFYVGGAGSTVGLLTSWAIGPQILWPRNAIRSSDGSCDEIAQLESALEKASNDEALMHSWKGHVGGKLFTLGMAAILGFGYKHWQQAVVTTAFGFALGEWMIGTRPRDGVEAVSRYRAGDLRALSSLEEEEERSSPLQFSFAIAPGQSSLLLRANF